MSSHRRALPLLVCAVLAVWAVVPSAQETRPRRTRTIHYTGALLEKSLRPDDEIVEIAPIGDSHGFQRPAPRQLFERVASNGLSTIVTVDVTGVSGLLTSEGSFVATQFVGRIAEVLVKGERPQAAELTVGAPVEFTAAGGEVAIRGVVVRSARYVYYPYPARYLVFLDGKQLENGWLTDVSPPLLVSGDSVAPVAPAGSLLTGLTLTEMRAIVKGLK